MPSLSGANRFYGMGYFGVFSYVFVLVVCVHVVYMIKALHKSKNKNKITSLLQYFCMKRSQWSSIFL